jgi:hypothetical protein
MSLFLLVELYRVAFIRASVLNMKRHVVNFSSGLPLKKLDKKLERTLLHSYRKVFISAFL